MKSGLLVAILVSCGISALAQAKDPTLCQVLQSLRLPNTTVTAAAVVVAGPYALPGNSCGNTPTVDLPAYCRVMATIKPTVDSDIGIEIWMPVAEWNGKMLGTGNVNWCGGVNPLALALGLREHYAAAGTDRGHKSCHVDASFAARPEKLAEFGYRAVHEMTLKANALVAAYYGTAARHSYFSGGSSGGGEALMEAQRYPEDYEGIVAGAPTDNFTRLMAARLWNAQVASVLRGKRFLLRDAVIPACDSPDAIGLLDDPRQCNFDPEALLCPGAEDSLKCLTRPQVEAAKNIYRGPTNPRTGAAIYPGLERGSEDGWAFILGPGENPLEYFRYLVHEDPNWDWHGFDLDRDVVLADQKGEEALNAIDPDLQRFADRGGKLILSHGWGDPTVAPAGHRRLLRARFLGHGKANT
jgi:feruloyl esterase